MKSIRSELMIRLIVGVGAIILIGGVVLAIATKAALVREFDNVLEAKARSLAALTSREGDTLEIDYDGDYFPHFGEVEEPEYFEFRTTASEVLLQSDSLESELQAPSPTDGEELVFRNVILPDGETGRIVHLHFAPRVEPEEEEDEEDLEEEDDEYLYQIDGDASAEPFGLTVSVARNREGLDALIFGLYGALGVIALLSLAGIGFLVWDSLARGLRPIAEVDRQIRSITSDSLDSRVDLTSPPVELDGIVRTINDLMTRLQGAFERERRFSSDVAHELRTPVSELRTACEVGARCDDDPTAIQELFDDVRDIALHMEAVVDNLLMLAACENGMTTIAMQPVNLRDFVLNCWKRNDQLVRERSLRIDCQLDESIEATSDRDKLELILQNLVDNAVKYSLANSTITCHAEVRADELDLVIANDVHGLEQEDMKHLTERFWRKESVRTNGNHAGLGLSIVRTLCELLGAELRISLIREDRFEARLSLAAKQVTPMAVKAG